MIKDDHYKELIEAIRQEIIDLLDQKHVRYIPIEKIKARLEIIASIQRVQEEKEI